MDEFSGSHMPQDVSCADENECINNAPVLDNTWRKYCDKEIYMGRNWIMPLFVVFNTRGTQNVAGNKKLNKQKQTPLFKSHVISFVHIVYMGKIIYKQTLYIGWYKISNLIHVSQASGWPVW
jgi:hypothetical protein